MREGISPAHQFWLDLIRGHVRLANLSCQDIAEKAKCCHGAQVFAHKGKVSDFLRAVPKRHPNWKYVFAVQQILGSSVVSREVLARLWADGARSDNRDGKWIARSFRDVRLWSPETSEVEQEFLTKYPAKPTRAGAAAGGLAAVLLATSVAGFAYFDRHQPDPPPRNIRMYIQPETVGNTLGLQRVTLHQDLAVELPGSEEAAYIRRGETIYLGCFRPDNTFGIAGTPASVGTQALARAGVPDSDWYFTKCQGPFVTPSSDSHSQEAK
ncbi:MULTISPECIES: hypothetical protein [unclassified Streptomyces]|jgi:hypothetical protein|uniref:hypothetical protein n=1 Tax=unclassified Streptomyces TaxID=2593676 RepID=UPI0024746DAD|nr:MULTISPECIES: hypothetical protein [unclassified Streptomyces]